MSTRDSWPSLRGSAGLDLARASFLPALAVLLIVTTRWRIWETNATRQSTDDA